MINQEIFRCAGVSMTEQFNGEGSGRFQLYANRFYMGEEYNNFAERKIALAQLLRVAAYELERAE